MRLFGVDEKSYFIPWSYDDKLWDYQRLSGKSIIWYIHFFQAQKVPQQLTYTIIDCLALRLNWFLCETHNNLRHHCQRGTGVCQTTF